MSYDALVHRLRSAGGAGEGAPLVAAGPVLPLTPHRGLLFPNQERVEDCNTTTVTHTHNPVRDVHRIRTFKLG